MRNSTIDKSGLGSLSPDGRLLVTWEKPDNKCVLWDIASVPPRRIGIVSDANPYLHYFSPDGRWLAVCLPGDFADQWEIWETVPLRRHLRQLSCANASPTFTSDSRTIVCKARTAHEPTWIDRFFNRNVGTAYDIAVWDLQTGQELTTFYCCEDFACFPDGKHLAISRTDSTVEVLEIPLRRTRWIDCGLPALFVLFLLLGCWHWIRFQTWAPPLWQRRQATPSGRRSASA
jgi:WD40 repeat protein